MFITALLTVRTAWKQSGGLSGWEGQWMRHPHCRCRPPGHRCRMWSRGQVGVWLQTESMRETWGEDLLSAVALHRQKEHSSEKSRAAQDTSSLARVKGSGCLQPDRRHPPWWGWPKAHDTAVSTKAQASLPHGGRTARRQQGSVAPGGPRHRTVPGTLTGQRAVCVGFCLYSAERKFKHDFMVKMSF